MKLIKFKARRVSDNKLVRGSWLASARPNCAQKIAERLAKGKLKNFMLVVKDIKA